MVDDLSRDAGALGIKILPILIDEASVENMKFDTALNNSDAMMVISDPLFLNNENAVKNLFSSAKKEKKPIIAYHELFIQYGATLVISADNPTIGRQIATMIESNLNKGSIEKIQYPAGTNIVFNKRKPN